MSDNSVEKVVLTDFDVLKCPLVSEKIMMRGEARQYCFAVDIHARKPAIKNAVERIFGVKVVSVNTLIRKGKNKVFRGHRARRGDVKHAMVVLADGYSISSVMPGGSS
ncbi:MAG: 50S ribosomal protein L23 [Holosporales bacterium]|jgi:large subunit ribosomal protein L23|nr:50S ribosomal protein L23 [Holosporales bacterium]